jgi:serine/threonine protein kinase/Tfp pilus assembly protein PilF
MLASGAQLGPYQVLAPLGAGGMGDVYRAKDSRLDREVAIKVLPEPFARDPSRLARFEREVKAVAALSHPNILAIHDYGTEQGVCFAVMELLEGETLRQRLRQAALPWRKTVQIGMAIADGLAAAHAKGIIHRDLKPENVFLTTDGRVKILDFGLARVEAQPSVSVATGPYQPALTGEGEVMGTVGYMSPEQVRGQVADARSDIFALGCVLYEMVSGQRPFARATAADTQAAILHDDPPELPADHCIPLELARVIRHSLEKNREERFQTARDLAFALRALQSDPGLISTTSRPGQRWLAALLLILALAGIALYFFLRDGKHEKTGPAPTEDKALDSLAVLPFVNDSNAPDAEHLGEDMALSLTISLTKVRTLTVKPFDSVARFKGRETDAQATGRELQVAAVVTGRIRKRGDDLLISFELVDVRKYKVIHGREYQRKFANLLTVQADLAQEIARELRLTLTGEEEKDLTRLPTRNLQAHEHYILGRLEWNKRTAAGMKKAEDHFQRAIEADPNYAHAYAGLADVYTLSVQHGILSPKQAAAKAKKALSRALELDNRLAEAYTTRANLRYNYEWDWAGAEESFRKALQLQPNYATARHWYSMYLANMGRVDEALSEARRAQALAPDSPVIAANVGKMLRRAGRPDEAIRHLLLLTKEGQPFVWNHWDLGNAYLEKKMYAEAISHLEKARALEEDETTLSGLAYGYARAGDVAKAREVLQQLQALAQRTHVSPVVFAWVYVALGENDKALDLLEEGYEKHLRGMIGLRADPDWASLRSHPRFQALVKKMNFPP